MAIDSVSGGLFADLFYLYLAIAATVGTLVIGWLVTILVKFRARPGQPRPRDAPRAGVLPAERGHPLWSYIMALVIAGIMFGLAFGTISAVHTIETPPHEGEVLPLEVVGFQFGWKVVYTGAGGIPVGRVNEWSIPVDTPIVANVTSQDVWHNYALTEFRVRIDVIPGQTNHLWWEAHELGDAEPVCVQLCGLGHTLMKATMHVVPKADFAKYLAVESQKEYAKLEKAGQLVNVTYEGAAFALEGATKEPAKPFAVRIENQGDSTERFDLGAELVTLEPGETGLLYAKEGRATLTAQGSGASRTFGEVS